MGPLSAKRPGPPWRLRLALIAAWACWPLASQAHSLSYCERPVELSVAQQDVLLRFAGIVKAELAQSGRGVALVSRSGQDLRLLRQRYSHAGLSLKASEGSAWAVRQLYFSCEEQQPRIFDQGIPGFVFGTDSPKIGYVSLVFLPEEPAQVLERAALDKRLALQVLSPHYSANSYAFGLQYQNCNQWVIELMAAAWGGGMWAAEAPEPRAGLQDWLKAQHYQPSQIELGYAPLMWVAYFTPWLQNEDHPAEDLAANRYQVSMPASIEAFVHARYPQAQRVEICHAENRVVIHRGWGALGDGCMPGDQDEVRLLAPVNDDAGATVQVR